MEGERLEQVGAGRPPAGGGEVTRRCFGGTVLGLCVEGQGEQTRLILRIGDIDEREIAPSYLEMVEPKKMVEAIIRQIKERYGSVPENLIIPLYTDLMDFEKHRVQALRLYNKLLYKVREKEAPPSRSSIYIVRVLEEFPRLIVEIWQGGRMVQLGWDDPPSETVSWLRILQRRFDLSGDEGDSVIDAQSVGGRDIYTAAQLLEELELDPEKPYTVQVFKVPYLYVYEAGDKSIILSRSWLGAGDVQVRLRPVEPAELIKLVTQELDHDAADRLLRILKKRAGVKKLDEERLEKLARDAVSWLFWAEKGADDVVVDHYLSPENWAEILKTIREGAELDPLIRAVYEGLALPYFDPLTAPHLAIFTTTEAGKTTMYRLVVGEDPHTSLTAMTLAGGILQDTKKPVKGVVHNRRLALQIEGLEANEKRQVLQYALDYMRSGRIKRGAGGRQIISQGTAPLIFTGNIIAGEGRLTLQTLIQEGLLDNPEALGSRLVIFYRETEKARFPRYVSVERAWRVVHEVRDNPTLEAKLRRVWRNPRVREWLEAREPLPVEDLRVETGLEKLTHYLRVLIRSYSPRLKALALNRALLEKLPDVWADKLDVEALLDDAEETYNLLRSYLLETLIRIGQDFSQSEALNWVDAQPGYFKVLVSAALRLAATTNEETLTVNLNDVAGVLEEAVEVLKERGKLPKRRRYDPRDIIRSLKRRITDLHSGAMSMILAEMGVDVGVKGDDVVVRIDVKRARLAAVKLHEYA